jgi:hypothetical protein
MASYGSRHTCSVITFIRRGGGTRRPAGDLFLRPTGDAGSARACRLLPWTWALLSILMRNRFTLLLLLLSLSLLRLTCEPRSIVFTVAHHGAGEDPLHPARLERTIVIGLQTFGFLPNRTPKDFSSQIGLQRILLFYYRIVALFNQFWNIEIHVFYCIDQATLVLLFWINRM